MLWLSLALIVSVTLVLGRSEGAPSVRPPNAPADEYGNRKKKTGQRVQLREVTDSPSCRKASKMKFPGDGPPIRNLLDKQEEKFYEGMLVYWG